MKLKYLTALFSCIPTITGCISPIVYEAIPIVTSTSSTPGYTFFSNLSFSTIEYVGPCSSQTTSIERGYAEIQLNPLADGTYSNCSIIFKDQGIYNLQPITLNISSFTIDTTPPQLTEDTPVASPARTFTPEYTFNTDEAGTILSSGDCSTNSIEANNGNNTISFEALENGLHNNCTISVKDAAGNTSLPLSVSAFTIDWISKPLNDTGRHNCGDYAFDLPGINGFTGSGTHNNDLNCSIQSVVPTQESDGVEVVATGSDVIRAGQDALYGRDANAEFNDDADGHKGFSFTKIDATGNDLPASAITWSCVRDNVTNFIWEVKTTKGLQSNANTYSWYNSTGFDDGGAPGTADGGSCSGGTGCDTEKYVFDINSQTLCGENDWVVPSMEEISSIIHNDRRAPAIDLAYFPNTTAAPTLYFWTRTPYYGGANAFVLKMYDGGNGYGNKSQLKSIRLVRNND